MVTEVRERRRHTYSSRSSDDESSGPGPPGVRSDMVALKRSGSPTNIPHDMRARACLDAVLSRAGPVVWQKLAGYSQQE